MDWYGPNGIPNGRALGESWLQCKGVEQNSFKAEPLEKSGAILVNSPSDLSDVDVLATMVSTGKDVEQLYFGENRVLNGGGVPRIFLDFSSIGVDQSAEIRSRLSDKGADLICSPVSGNGKCVASKLSAVASGPQTAFSEVEEIIAEIAVMGVSYVGEGELARFCKIAHNVMLGVVTQNLAEITILAQKAGVPRRAFPGLHE